MNPVTHRPATIQDAVWVAEHLREQDRKEVLASNGGDFQKALVDSFLSSTSCTAWELRGKVICISGVAPAAFPGPFSGGAVPWMLGTDGMLEASKSLVKQGRKFIEGYLQDFPCLFNFVHAHNTTSIAWLHRLGFRFGQLIPEYGVGKQPFILFYRYRNV